MADAQMKIEMDELEYRIVGPGGEEGPETEYGEVAVLRVGPAVYYATVDDPNEAAPVVFRVDTVTEMPTEQEDVVFGDGEEEEEDEEDEEDEEEPEEVTVPRGEPEEEEEPED